MVAARLFIALVCIGVPSFLILRWWFDHLDEVARGKRRDKFQLWTQTVAQMQEPEKTAAMALMLKVLREQKSDYRGPWEAL